MWQVDDLRRRNLSLDDLYDRGYLKTGGSWLELRSSIERGNTRNNSTTGSQDVTSHYTKSEVTRQLPPQVY